MCWFKILRLYFKGGVPFHHIVVNILIDFSLTVKAATLIFIPGRLFHLLRKGNQILSIIW